MHRQNKIKNSVSFIKVFYLFNFSFVAINLIVFLALIKINYSLLLGYSIGVLVSFFIFLTNEVANQIKISKVKSRAVIIVILKTWFVLIFFSVFLIAIIFVNKNNPVLNFSYANNGPINYLTFIYALLSTQLNALISWVIYYKKNKKKGSDNVR
ncbi:hypothetical protein V2E24_00760 [Mycoplasmopsis ciconiae]|uniref:Uncharacterized protein n=1 Tax=Mycoplasmopsis ciconiae TaxID=561067 RepID=A0ABU7MLP9_9BACT|nr:hypothetical protein [Mycoplasmopsis ciconiae]